MGASEDGVVRADGAGRFPWRPRRQKKLAIPEFLRGRKGTVGNGFVRREVKADIGWVTLDRVSRVTGGIGTELAVDGRLRATGTGQVRWQRCLPRRDRPDHLLRRGFGCRRRPLATSVR
jgi:hypothetical protein